jgi:hypothetical protein
MWSHSVQKILELPNSKTYENFAYHVELLSLFVRAEGGAMGRSQSFREERSVHGSNVFKDFVKNRRNPSSPLENTGHVVDTDHHLSRSLPNYSRQPTM